MTAPKPLYLATRNQHKLQEIEALLSTKAWDLRLASALATDVHWDETGATFAENALIKASAIKRLTPSAVIADDSGLVVDALNGAPGVYSARYAGEGAGDRANLEKLLAALAGVPPEKRTARFMCVIAFIDEANKSYTFSGACEGVIIDAPRGSHGFGYDPIFIPRGYSQSFAEIDQATKNKISHRSQAVLAWQARFG